MADEEQRPSGLVQELMAQFRAAAERLESLAGLGGKPPGGFPLPGALSASQTKALADSIAAQRRSIQALQAQLSAFEEQLATMEQLIGPLAEWSRSWADLEERLIKLGRRPQAG